MSVTRSIPTKKSKLVDVLFNAGKGLVGAGSFVYSFAPAMIEANPYVYVSVICLAGITGAFVKGNTKVKELRQTEEDAADHKEDKDSIIELQNKATLLAERVKLMREEALKDLNDLCPDELCAEENVVAETKAVLSPVDLMIQVRDKFAKEGRESAKAFQAMKNARTPSEMKKLKTAYLDKIRHPLLKKLQKPVENKQADLTEIKIDVPESTPVVVAPYRKRDGVIDILAEGVQSSFGGGSCVYAVVSTIVPSVKVAAITSGVLVGLGFGAKRSYNKEQELKLAYDKKQEKREDKKTKKSLIQSIETSMEELIGLHETLKEIRENFINSKVLKPTSPVVTTKVVRSSTVVVVPKTPVVMKPVVVAPVSMDEIKPVVASSTSAKKESRPTRSSLLSAQKQGAVSSATGMFSRSSVEKKSGGFRSVVPGKV